MYVRHNRPHRHFFRRKEFALSVLLLRLGVVIGRHMDEYVYWHSLLFLGVLSSLAREYRLPEASLPAMFGLGLILGHCGSRDQASSHSMSP